MKKYLLLFFLILAILGLVYFNLFILGKKETQRIIFPERPTPNPTLIFLEPTISKVKEEGGQVPFDYKVIEVLGETVKITGLKGEMILTKNPSILVFWKKNGETSEAKFSDLAVGQKLILEKASPPSREIKVYIVQE